MVFRSCRNWNRQLDFLVINILPENIIPKIPEKLKYMEDDTNAVERQLSHAKVSDYSSFIHSSYADTVIERANNYLEKGLDLNINGPHSILKN